MQYYVYILASRTNVTIYTGVTNDLVRRVWEHINSCDPSSFTSRYKTHKLVYYEIANDPYQAITREKQIKSWNRAKKNALISGMNPEWKDLYEDILG